MLVARRRAATIVACTLASGVIVGSGLVAWADSPDKPPVGLLTASNDPLGLKEAPAAPPKLGEPVSIGPWEKGKAAPDLVPIDLEDGRSGFLRTYDMVHGSLDADFTRRVNENTTETVLPLYAKDGQTVIGEFVASTATWE